MNVLFLVKVVFFVRPWVTNGCKCNKIQKLLHCCTLYLVLHIPKEIKRLTVQLQHAKIHGKYAKNLQFNIFNFQSSWGTVRYPYFWQKNGMHIHFTMKYQEPQILKVFHIVRHPVMHTYLYRDIYFMNTLWHSHSKNQMQSTINQT